MMLRHLRSWYQSHIDSQYRQPRGMVGRSIGQRMAAQHQPENQWTVGLLLPQPGETILEIGFGPGIALQAVLQDGARVAGVDFSQTMVEVAKRRNHDASQDGRCDLRLASADALPFADSTFDKAFSIHSIYFWKQPLTGLREAYRVLKPGGLLILTVLPKERWVPEGSEMPVGTPECTPYSGGELAYLLIQAGFVGTEIRADTEPHHRSNYSVIGYK